MTRLLEGKRCIVTGGSRGLGLAMCVAFARHGARVALTYKSDDTSAEDATKRIAEIGEAPLVFKGSVADAAHVRSTVEALTGSGGYLSGCEICPGPPAHSLFKWTAVFLYKDVDSPGELRGIYRQDRTKRPVITDYLARLPFPARHPNEGFAPFLFRCKGRTCQFISSAVEPGVSLSYRYHWDFGDGTVGTGRVLTHTFPAAGQYYVVSGVDVPAGPVASDVRLLQVK